MHSLKSQLSREYFQRHSPPAPRDCHQPGAGLLAWSCKALYGRVSNDTGVLITTKFYASPGRRRGGPWVCSLQKNYKRLPQTPSELLSCETVAREGGGFAKTLFCSTGLRPSSSHPLSSICFLMMTCSITKANALLSCPLQHGDTSFITNSSQESVHQEIKNKPSDSHPNLVLKGSSCSFSF